MVSFDTEEVALPQPNVSAAVSLSSESTLENEVSAAVSLSSESTLENEVELMIRVVKPAPTIHSGDKDCRKEELATLAAITLTRTTNTQWYTSNGESAWSSISTHEGRIDWEASRRRNWLTRAEEEKTLKDAVINWGAIAEPIPDRSKQQCRNICHIAVDPCSDHTTERTGQWSGEEENKLKHAVEKYGDDNWDVIAALVPGRTRSQCLWRWHVAVDPIIDRPLPSTGRWTTDEDNKLKKAAEKYGGKNWDVVSALVLGRTRKQCRDRWKYLMETSINRAAGRTGKWTIDEDDKLKDLVQTHGSKNNWNAIAALVSGRTRNQCMHRWQSGLRTSIDRMTNHTGKWTKDEDAMLVGAVEKHNGKNWEAIAALVLFRSKVQCWNRWNNPGFRNSSNQIFERKGKWTPDEDKKLKYAVQMHDGKHWDAIAALVPGRAKTQCWSRWHDAVEPSIDHKVPHTGRWTTEEDDKLREAAEKYGGKNWVAIAALVPGRMRRQCRNRWAYTLNPGIKT
jgi:hypothetical protein